MILEIARLMIDPDRAAAFERAVAAARPHFLAAPGCLSFRLDQVLEESGVYLLMVGWTSVKAHMVDFRGSAGFQAWRDLASPFFVQPPTVLHTRTLFIED